MRRTALAATALLLAGAWPAAGQARVAYEVSFPNAAHHEAEVEAVFEGLPDGPLEIRMSRTSPGRYALHEFAKNVYDVRIEDGAGRPLDAERPDLHQWNVAGHDGTVRFRYTLYADRADGTYPGIDLSHAHLNMPAVFAWARGLEEAPITVRFRPPEGSGWKVATQLAPTADPFVFASPDLAYFLDSPTELSDFDLREFTVESEGRPQTIRLAVHHLGTPAEVDRYAEMAEKVVREQMAVWGELPDFDYGTYTFLADYLPWVAGDGMEHRNSTVLTSTRPLATGMLRNLGTLSHEFFHAWNMERLRSAALEPFDFEAANPSRELWFGEGFTSYYDDLTIARAGLVPLEDYAAGLARTLDAVVRSPARRFGGPADMSFRAPFVDAAASVDETNFANTFLSYYTWGAAVGLGLDLLLRTRYGTTLDDYMRALWEDHGEPFRPYATDDLRRVLARVSGDPAFADHFFRTHVEGGDVVDYAALLAHAGLALRPARPGRAWIGPTPLRDEAGAVVVAGDVLIGTPLYGAGLDEGDRILAVDGRPLRSAADLLALLEAASPGDALPVTFEQRGRTREAVLALVQDPTLEVVTFEAAGRPVTDAIRAFRADWLGSRQPAAAKMEP